MRSFMLDREKLSEIFLQLAVCLLLALSPANALTLTKDTVYTSDLLGRTDSVSLLNPTNVTLSIDSMVWKTPIGKYAEMVVGFNLPYGSKDSFEAKNIDLVPIKANHHNIRPLEILWYNRYGHDIPPNGRIPITGFDMVYSFLLPLAKSYGKSNASGSLTTLMVFYAGIRTDTLTIIGTVRQSASGINSPSSRDNDALPSHLDPEKEKTHNAVGRILRRGHPINSNSESEIHFRFPRGR